MKRFLSLLLCAALLCTAFCGSASAASYSSLISDVLDDWSSSDSRASGAPQQAVNGAYRCVELLAIVGMENQ